MNPELLNRIKNDIKTWHADKVERKKCLQRVKNYFVPGLNDILSFKFKVRHPKVEFVGMGACNIVVRIGKHMFRVSYDKATPEYASHVKHEFEVLRKHDFGILAPLDYRYQPPNIWWHQVQPASPYQGATLVEYSKLLHKVIKLSKYNLYWFDIHNGNLMRDKDGNLVVADFDTNDVNDCIKPHISRYRNIKLSSIKPLLDVYIGDGNILTELRYMIFAYLKIPLSNENWMKFCFGEFIYKSKYNISNCYPSSLFSAQVKHRGNLGF